MFMLVNKIPYISCVNDIEMWVLEEKQSSFLFLGWWNPILGKLRRNEKKSN